MLALSLRPPAAQVSGSASESATSRPAYPASAMSCSPVRTWLTRLPTLGTALATLGSAKNSAPLTWKVTKSRRVPVSPPHALVPVLQWRRNACMASRPAPWSNTPATVGPPSLACGRTPWSACSVTSNSLQ